MGNIRHLPALRRFLLGARLFRARAGPVSYLSWVSRCSDSSTLHINRQLLVQTTKIHSETLNLTILQWSPGLSSRHGPVV